MAGPLFEVGAVGALVAFESGVAGVVGPCGAELWAKATTAKTGSATIYIFGDFMIEPPGLGRFVWPDLFGAVLVSLKHLRNHFAMPSPFIPASRVERSWRSQPDLKSANSGGRTETIRLLDDFLAVVVTI
jgi:hypothetical protein